MLKPACLFSWAGQFPQDISQCPNPYLGWIWWPVCSGVHSPICWFAPKSLFSVLHCCSQLSLSHSPRVQVFCGECLSLLGQLLQNIINWVASEHQKSISNSSGGWEVQDQGPGTVNGSWFTEGHHLAVPSHCRRGLGALWALSSGHQSHSSRAPPSWPHHLPYHHTGDQDFNMPINFRGTQTFKSLTVRVAGCLAVHNGESM